MKTRKRINQKHKFNGLFESDSGVVGKRNTKLERLCVMDEWTNLEDLWCDCVGPSRGERCHGWSRLYLQLGLRWMNIS